jgi:ABC-type xylose transport system permease subunit
MKKSSLKISKTIDSDYKSESAVAAVIAKTASNPAAELTLAERVMAPTPKFFKTLRTIGLVIGLVGGAILASPVLLPAAVVTVGGYLALAGSIVTGVSQTAVGKE